jgi:hypothetical protein
MDEAVTIGSGGMINEPVTDDALERAVRRLDRALGQLEERLNRPGGQAETAGMSEDDRARLTAELDAARARERELAIAGEQASQALGRAIAEIRAALAQTQEPEKGAA